jgi:hypothetical protein
VICSDVDPIAHREVYKRITIGFHPGKSNSHGMVLEACRRYTPAEAAWVWRHVLQVAAGVSPPAQRSQDRAKVPRVARCRM